MSFFEIATLTILILQLVIGIIFFTKARTAVRQLYIQVALLRKETNHRFEALGPAVGNITTEVGGRLEAMGTAIGNLTNEASGRLEAMGTAIGHLKKSIELISADPSVVEKKLDRIQQGVVTTNFLLGKTSRPGDIVLGARANYENLDLNWNSFRDTSEKTETSPQIKGPRDRTAVVVTLGQSNAANHGEGIHIASGRVDNFNIYDGRCYRAADPLLGTSGVGGNFATRFGDIVIARGHFDRVIIAPIAMGGTNAEQWADEGPFNNRIATLIRRMFDAELRPDFIFWHLGDGDPGAADPGGHLHQMQVLEVVRAFRQFGIDSPFFICITGNADENIRAAQLEVINKGTEVYPGPDLSTIPLEYRTEGMHFNSEGLTTLATMWANSIGAYLSSRPKTSAATTLG